MALFPGIGLRERRISYPTPSKSDSWSTIVPSSGVTLSSDGYEATLYITGTEGVTISGLQGGTQGLTHDHLYISGLGVQQATDHTNLLNIGSNTHPQLDALVDSGVAHFSDITIHYLTTDIDHTDLQNIGSNTHPQLDALVDSGVAHFTDTTIHFTEASIDHTNILNIGNNTHDQLDALVDSGVAHFNDTTIHFTEGSIDHGSISGLTDDDHAIYLLADGSRALTGDLDLGGNNVTNVNLVDGRDISTDGEVLDRIVDSGVEHFNDTTTNPHNITLSGIGGTTDHTELTNIGSNTHDQLDALVDSGVAHFIDTTIHFTETSIDHTQIQNIGNNTHDQLDALVDSGVAHFTDNTIHFVEGDIDHGSISGLDDDDHTQYLLTNGTRAMSGDLDLGGNSITSVNLVDSRDVSVDGDNLDRIIDSGIEHFNDTDNPHEVTLADVGGTTDHTALTNIGNNTHDQIDALIDSGVAHFIDTTIHYTQAEIDHLLIQNIGNNTHAQLDALVDSGVSHFNNTSNPHEVSLAQVGGTTDHTALSNIGSNTHDQIDTLIDSGVAHFNDDTIHFTQAYIDHGSIDGLTDDDHTQYIPVDGNRGFTSTVSGITPVLDNDLATKSYVDGVGGGTSDHGELDGLADDDHSQYALLAGRSGGQQIYGGTDSYDQLILTSTSDASPGYVVAEDPFACLDDVTISGVVEIGDTIAGIAALAVHETAPNETDQLLLSTDLTAWKIGVERSTGDLLFKYSGDGYTAERYKWSNNETVYAVQQVTFNYTSTTGYFNFPYINAATIKPRHSSAGIQDALILQNNYNRAVLDNDATALSFQHLYTGAATVQTGRIISYVDDATNKHASMHFYVANSGTAIDRWQIDTAGDLLPITDNDLNLGSSSYRVREVHLGPSSLLVHNDAVDIEKGIIGYDSDIFTIASSGVDAQISLKTNSIEVIRVTEDQRVGIYTDEPTARFHVVGDIRVQNGPTYNSNILIGEDEWRLLLENSGGRKLHVYDDVNNVRCMTFDYNGKVGILSTTPDANLQVVGDTKLGDDNTNYLYIGSTGDAKFVGTAGLIFGSFYGTSISWAQAAAQNTWYNISDSDIADGQLNNVTHDGSGMLTCSIAGKYLINFSLCYSLSTSGNTEVGIEISSSGSAEAGSIIHVYKNAAWHNNVSGSCILDLDASDTIELCIRTTDAGSPGITVDFVNLTCVQIGG